MKNRRMTLLAALVFGIVLACVSCAQEKVIKTTIEDILANPGTYLNERVEVKGIVDRYIKGTSSTTSYYLLKGFFGGVLRVNSTQTPPRINQPYTVNGIVGVDSATNEVSLTEIPIQDGPQLWLILVLIAAALAIIALIIVLVLQSSRRAAAKEVHPEPAPPVGTAPSVPENERSDLTTVRIVLPPRTMKFVPGELVITSGEDAGKSFRIAGYPTPEGSLVTIGKESVAGERAYSHIRIDDRYLTVSRKQAELLYRDGKLYIRNRSNTNYTQIDGRELGPGEMSEVQNGSTMRMGELEIQYKR